MDQNHIPSTSPETPQRVVYQGHERPRVRVVVAGEWLSGRELHKTRRGESLAWTHTVMFFDGEGKPHIAEFLDAEVRTTGSSD